MAASNIIIDKIKDDPQSASCPNISYTGITGPVANANPTGSPYAIGNPAIVDATHPALQAMLGHYVISGQPSIVQTGLPSSPLIAHHHPALSTISLPATELSSINGGLASLASYPYGLSYNALSVVPGVHPHLHTGIATSLGVIPSGSVAGALSPAPSATPLLSATPSLSIENGSTVQAAQALSLPNNYLASLASAAYLTAGHQLVNSPSVAGTASSASLPSASGNSSNISVASSSTTPVPASVSSSPPSVSLLGIEKSSDGQRETVELSIPETLIGAVLGKAGRTLVEFQDISGAKIQISKKGEYVVGTRNRKVTITGKPPCPQTAQFLISQRVLTAQAVRSQQVKYL